MKLSKRKVHKFTYPGKTASDINNELSTIDIYPTPLHVIVHAGTNKTLCNLLMNVLRTLKSSLLG